jgi:hypothetical protein
LARSDRAAQPGGEGRAKFVLRLPWLRFLLGLTDENQRQLASLDNAAVAALLLDFYLDPQIGSQIDPFCGRMAFPPFFHRPDWVMDCPGAADRLLRVWQEGPEVTRDNALRLLSGCDDPWVDAVLRQALAAESPSCRAAAAEAIGWRRSPAQVPSVLDCWDQETDPHVRLALLRALTDLRDHRALPVFTAALQDPGEEIQIAAIWGLETLADPGSVQALEAVFLNDPSPAVGRAILSAWEQIGTPDAQVLLHQAAYEADPTLRGRAVQALGHLRVRDAAETVRQRLGDPDTYVRIAAVQALPLLLGREAVRTDLQKACQDPEPEVRIAALRKITGLGFVAAQWSQWPSILHDPEPSVRFEALRALQSYPGALPPEVLRSVRHIQEHDYLLPLRRLAGKVLKASERTSRNEP